MASPSKALPLACTFVIGCASLFSWNAVITISSYWKTRFCGSLFETSFESVFAVTYQLTSLASNVYALRASQELSVRSRIVPTQWAPSASSPLRRPRDDDGGDGDLFALFVPLLFLEFNVFDFVGRASAESSSRRARALFFASRASRSCRSSLARSGGAGGAPGLRSSAAPFAVMAPFALSNGLVATLAMGEAPQLVAPHKRELAGNVMCLFLTLGLTAGSASFALALVYYCRAVSEDHHEEGAQEHARRALELDLDEVLSEELGFDFVAAHSGTEQRFDHGYARATYDRDASVDVDAVDELLVERALLRQCRDFEAADGIHAQLRRLGVEYQKDWVVADHYRDELRVNHGVIVDDRTALVRWAALDARRP
ncbi:nucleoside transmembrane transporter [Aureococcus anophagefferens]|nr:nucleoside transmembrane transporter [Aureococcus anophagefferens]